MSKKQETSLLDSVSTPIDNHFYKLVNHEPVRCSFAEYAQNMLSESNRIIAQDTVAEILVSTIFTGIDHSFGLGEKLLFETIVFDLLDDIHPTWRYSTWNEAMEQHKKIVSLLQENGPGLLIEQIKEKAGESGHSE